MNLAQLLGRDGDKATFNEESMRLTEVDAAGKIIEPAIRFQFDRCEQLLKISFPFQLFIFDRILL